MTATGRSRWALAGLTIAVIALGFDVTILNTALPTIATELDAGTNALQWMVNAYTLMFAGLLMPLGALADRFGRRRCLLVGLAVFAAASVVAMWADNAGQVIAARAALGAGAAVILPATLASLAALFSGADRTRAVSVLVAGMGAGVPLGPVVGGYLLEHFWWGAIFLINIPIVALSAVLVVVCLPESRDPVPPRFDPVAGLLSTAGLVAFVYGVIEAPDRGWGSPLVIAVLTVSIVLLSAFVWWELRQPEPMIDLRLFGNPQFRWGTVNAALGSFSLFGLLFVVPQFLQFVLGADAFGTGLRLLPLILGLVVGSGVSTRLAARFGHKWPIVSGLVIMAVGLFAGTVTEPSTGYAVVAAWLGVAGLGVGATLAPAMDAALGVMPAERSGAGIAITMTMRQAGGAFGVALLGSLLSQVYTGRLDTAGLPVPVARAAEDSIAAAVAAAARGDLAALADDARGAYTDAMVVVLAVSGAVCVVTALLTALLMPTMRHSSGVSRPPDGRRGRATQTT